MYENKKEKKRKTENDLGKFAILVTNNPKITGTWRLSFERKNLLMFSVSYCLY